jgi:hypothetical protein
MKCQQFCGHQSGKLLCELHKGVNLHTISIWVTLETIVLIGENLPRKNWGQFPFRKSQLDS